MKYAGYIQLVHEILLLTHFDLKQRERKGGILYQNRQDALAFLETKWFENLCYAVDLDAQLVRKRLLHKSNERKRRTS